MGPVTRPPDPVTQSEGDALYGIGNRVAFIGDSLLAGSSANGERFSRYAQVLSGGRLHNIIESSYSGERSDQIFAHLSDLLAYDPQVVICEVGTNDVGQSRTLAQFQSAVTSGVSTIRGGGAMPAFISIPPRASASLVAEFNTWLMLYCRNERIPYIDVHRVLVDSSDGELLAAYDSGDGVHLSGLGQYRMGKRIAEELEGWLPPTALPFPLYNSDPLNLVTNGLMLTDAGPDGKADSWTHGSGTATPAYSLDSDEPNVVGKWQTFTWNGSQNGYRQMYQDVSVAGMTQGDIIAICCVFAIEDIADETVTSTNFQLKYTWRGPDTASLPFELKRPIPRGVIFHRVTVPSLSGVTALRVEIIGTSTSTVVTHRFGQVGVLNLSDLGMAA